MTRSEGFLDISRPSRPLLPHEFHRLPQQNSAQHLQVQLRTRGGFWHQRWGEWSLWNSFDSAWLKTCHIVLLEPLYTWKSRHFLQDNEVHKHFRDFCFLRHQTGFCHSANIRFTGFTDDLTPVRLQEPTRCCTWGMHTKVFDKCRKKTTSLSWKCTLKVRCIR